MITACSDWYVSDVDTFIYFFWFFCNNVMVQIFLHYWPIVVARGQAAFLDNIYMQWKSSSVIICQSLCDAVIIVAFSALTLLVGHQKEHLACKNWAMRCWCGYLSGARCRFFCIWPSWSHCISKPHHLLSDLNPDWFYLSRIPAYPGCPGKKAVKWVSK